MLSPVTDGENTAASVGVMGFRIATIGMYCVNNGVEIGRRGNLVSLGFQSVQNVLHVVKHIDSKTFE